MELVGAASDSIYEEGLVAAQVQGHPHQTLQLSVSVRHVYSTMPMGVKCQRACEVPHPQHQHQPRIQNHTLPATRNIQRWAWKLMQLH
jgi:hypothetical protein